MEEEFYDPMPKRLARRLKRESISNRAWKKAQQRVDEQKRDEQYITYYKKYTIDEFYASAMKSEGHWIRGGCSKTHCGLCQPWGLTHRDKKNNAKFEQDFNDFMEEPYWD